MKSNEPGEKLRFAPVAMSPDSIRLAGLYRLLRGAWHGGCKRLARLHATIGCGPFAMHQTLTSFNSRCDVTRFFPGLLVLLAIFVAPGIANAHPGHPGHPAHDGLGIGWGLMHPLTGWDHLLAGIGIGVLAAMTNGKLRLAILGSAGFGGILGIFCGMAVGSFPKLEVILAVSLLVIGSGIFFARAKASAVLPLMIAVAGIFHGWAHGAEMPLTFVRGLYLAGVFMGSALLVGVGMGIALRVRTRDALERVVGAVLLAAGATLLFL
jgi:urease accessory protein